jgi:diguanylate cyclase (GGDEF)-like protein
LCPTLLVISGPNVGALLPFPESGELIAGRSEECAFRLDDSSVSRKHANFDVVRMDGTLNVCVRDLGSTNGTHVGRRPVEGAPLELFDGDRLFVGDVELRFRLMDPEDIQIHAGLRREAEAAKRDALTGLYTRRYISERLPGLISSHRRNRMPLSIALLDLDHFKRVNDTYGHVQGDGVLFAVAEAVRGCIRGADIAVRYGGEEFAVVLPGASSQVASRIAERIRSAIARLNFPGTKPRLTSTASIGVATLRQREEIEVWFKRADQALYAAKDAGRNRLKVAEDIPEN